MGASASTTAKYSAKTTSHDIMKEFGSRARDKFVIVTGGNNGLGFETYFSSFGRVWGPCGHRLSQSKTRTSSSAEDQGETSSGRCEYDGIGSGVTIIDLTVRRGVQSVAETTTHTSKQCRSDGLSEEFDERWT